MPYEPPRDIYRADRDLGHQSPLTPEDSRYLDLSEERGESPYPGIARALGMGGPTLTAPSRATILILGPPGVGKSTELQRIALTMRESFFPVHLDISSLDPRTIDYPDIALGMAWALSESLMSASIEPEPGSTEGLWAWFAEEVRHDHGTTGFAARLEEGLENSPDLSYVRALLRASVEAVRSGASFQPELLRVIRDSFIKFTGGLSMLIKGAESALRSQGGASRVLFTIDGTDRLSREQTSRLFIAGAHRLALIEALVIAPARGSLMYESDEAARLYDCFMLPTIPIEDSLRAQERAAIDALSALLYQRAAPELFDSQATVEMLVKFSGGSVGEMLRLMHYTHILGEGDEYSFEGIMRAISKRAQELSRMLSPEDLNAIFMIDQMHGLINRDEREMRLIDMGAIFEYHKDGLQWMRSHPVVRTLDAYKIKALR